MPRLNKDVPDPAAALREAAYPLTDEHDEARIVAEVGEASLVLLGEASHGTHDFHALGARITRALIEQRGFSAVAIEGDWPDAYQVNRYVNGEGESVDAASALRGFERFPTWMWRNTAVAEFVGWLRHHNAAVDNPIGRGSGLIHAGGGGETLAMAMFGITGGDSPRFVVHVLVIVNARVSSSHSGRATKDLREAARA